MKKLVFPLVVTLLSIGFFAFAPIYDTLNIGDDAPMANTKMKATDSKSYALTDIKKENGLLVIFSCNTCPFVLEWEDQYPKLATLANQKEIGMVLVNSNEAKRENDDSMEAMKAHYTKAGYNMPYVLDEKHKLADAFGARTTPHVFLFDKNMKLVYKGLINDMYETREKTISKTYLEDAMKNASMGKEISPNSTKERGCSIKRVKA